MHEPTEFDHLTLDEIHKLTAADRDNAPGIDNQADAAQKLARKVSDSLDGIFSARSRIEGGSAESASGTDGWKAVGKVFTGTAASTTFSHISKLTDRTSSGHQAMANQSPVFNDLATHARNSHSNMDSLRTSREAELAALQADPDRDTPAAREAIVTKYNTKARQAAKADKNTYQQHAQRIQPIEKNSKKNTKKPWVDHTVPPKEQGTGLPKGGPPKLQTMTLHDSKTADVKPHHGGNGHHGGNHNGNQNGPQGKPHLHQNGPHKLGGKPRGGVNESVRTPQPRSVPRTQFSQARPVTEPVIGQRANTNTFGVAQSSPNTASSASPSNTTTTANSGVVPPIIGGRGRAAAMMPGARAPHASTPAVVATGKPPNPKSKSIGTPAPTKTFLTSGAGVRWSISPAITAAGRVIGVRGKAQTTRGPAIKPIAFRRSPRQTHGGQDGLNRAVVRNSRALPAQDTPSASTKRVLKPNGPNRNEPRSDAEWCDTSRAVPSVIRGARANPVAGEAAEHDPGEFLTRFNLGRRRLSE